MREPLILDEHDTLSCVVLHSPSESFAYFYAIVVGTLGTLIIFFFVPRKPIALGMFYSTLVWMLMMFLLFLLVRYTGQPRKISLSRQGIHIEKNIDYTEIMQASVKTRDIQWSQVCAWTVDSIAPGIDGHTPVIKLLLLNDDRFEILTVGGRETKFNNEKISAVAFISRLFSLLPFGNERLNKTLEDILNYETRKEGPSTVSTLAFSVAVGCFASILYLTEPSYAIYTGIAATLVCIIAFFMATTLHSKMLQIMDYPHLYIKGDEAKNTAINKPPIFRSFSDRLDQVTLITKFKHGIYDIKALKRAYKKLEAAMLKTLMKGGDVAKLQSEENDENYIQTLNSKERLALLRTKWRRSAL